MSAHLNGNGADDEAPRVPYLKSWRSTYIFVLITFLAYVGLLTLFTVVYS